jgi:hypothetical protein
MDDRLCVSIGFAILSSTQYIRFFDSMNADQAYLYTRMEAVEMAKLSPITYRFLPSGDSEIVLP